MPTHTTTDRAPGVRRDLSPTGTQHGTAIVQQFVATAPLATIPPAVWLKGTQPTVVSFWEQNGYEPRDERRARVICFLGFDPQRVD